MKTPLRSGKDFLLAVVSLSLFAACSAGPEDAANSLSEEALQAHVRFLSDDYLEGRAPGTRGGELAALYVASQFQTAGLEPVDGSYFQRFPMVGNTADPSSISLAFRSRGRTLTPRYQDDFMLWGGDSEATSSSSSGELVFVGYGINAPENDWNDFGGIDVKGKYLLVLVNDPPAPESDPELFGGRAMTYYGRWTYKYEEAARQGAAGALIIHTTEEAGYPWSVVRGGWSGEQFYLPPDPGGPSPTPVNGWLTWETASEVLESAGLDITELVAAAATRDFEAVPTGIDVSGALRSTVRRVETMNVVGLLRGSSRPGEVITITSHYDHLGVGEAVEGDSIYNGAYDNASATSLLIELGRAFASLEPSPARSILFIATGAEEQGLLGAAWYVQSPLYPLKNTVAEINVDGANLWGETEDMIAMGAERSELGPYIEGRAGQLGITLVPDAQPEKGFFFRSDHFPFAKAGVPSLYVDHGWTYRGKPAGWGEELSADYTANHYHAPSDEFSEDYVFTGAVQQGKLVFLTAYDLAQAVSFPNWMEGSEFRQARDAMMGEE